MLGAGTSVAAQARDLARLQAELSRRLPAPLRTALSVSGLRHGTLVLAAVNGATAHQARLKGPEIVRDLRARGVPITDVRVTVSPRPPARPPSPKHAILSMSARDALTRLADELPPSPLTEAVRRLVARQSRQEDAREGSPGQAESREPVMVQRPATTRRPPPRA